MVEIACAPCDKAASACAYCPLDHPLAKSAIEYVDRDIKPRLRQGYLAANTYYEDKAAPFWQSHAVPAWKEVYGKWKLHGKPLWDEHVSKNWERGSNLLSSNWEKRVMPMWHVHVVSNWEKHIAPHLTDNVYPHWNEHVAPRLKQAQIDISLYLSENFPVWKSSAESWIRRTWHSASVFVVHEAFPRVYRYAESLTIDVIIPFSKNVSEYLDKSFKLVGETEAFRKLSDSKFGTGVAEVYAIWRQGLDFIFNSVYCRFGWVEGAACSDAEAVQGQIVAFVTGQSQK